ncbi:cell adhesion molecule 3-like [Amphiura filiformis]|uniref:cell adhesion molecule 3-like n=1 Tax=Amphiura filiformis TaxID=82378 RepID=UPI003B20E3B2
MKVSGTFSGLVLIILHLTSASAISAIVSPTPMSVFVNGDVEFQCQIGDARGFTLVWLTENNPSDVAHTIIPAEQTGPIIDHHDDGHGDYSTAYSTEFTGGTLVHNLILRIASVQVADEGPYACGYQSGPSTSSPVGTWANLTILIPPDESNPRCSFSPNPVSLTTDSAIVTLICEIAGGSPSPDLTWNKGNPSNALSSTTSTINTFTYTITGNDNGIPFTCVAKGQALRQDGFCSITPLLVNPSVSISSSADPVVEHSDVIFTCVGSGLPYISKIDWLYNGQLLSDNNLPSGFQIIDMSDGSSELHLFSIQLDNNNDLVTCYVETASSLSNQQGITVSVMKYVEAKTTPSHRHRLANNYLVQKGH